MKKLIAAAACLCLALAACDPEPVEDEPKTSSTTRPPRPKLVVKNKFRQAELYVLQVRNEYGKVLDYDVEWYVYQGCDRGEVYKPTQEDGGCGLKPPQ